MQRSKWQPVMEGVGVQRTLKLGCEMTWGIAADSHLWIFLHSAAQGELWGTRICSSLLMRGSFEFLKLYAQESTFDLISEFISHGMYRIAKRDELEWREKQMEEIKAMLF
jgi:hypothetical protein